MDIFGPLAELFRLTEALAGREWAVGLFFLGAAAFVAVCLKLIWGVVHPVARAILIAVIRLLRVSLRATSGIASITAGASSAAVETPVFSLEPFVEPYETASDAGFYIKIRARVTDGVARVAKGSLVEIAPLDGSYIGDMHPGLLQWSGLFGGGDTATVTSGGANLDVFAFQNSGAVAVPVYAHVPARDPARSALGLSGWTVRVEVASGDGASGECAFHVMPGSNEAHSSIIRASMNGTLYGPRVEVTPQ